MMKKFVVDVETTDHDADLMNLFAGHLTGRFAGTAYRILDVKAIDEPGRAAEHRSQSVANWIADTAMSSPTSWSSVSTNGAGVATLQFTDGSEYVIVVTEKKPPKE